MSALMRRISLPGSRRDSLPNSRREANRMSFVSDTSESSGDERDFYDDEESLMQHANDSQSSLDVSLEDMDLDSEDFEERCRISPISRLPAELLISVFAKLSSTADVKSCMLVSKAWARCSVDLLWHRPTTSNWKSLMNVIQTARKSNGFFAYHDLVRRLNLAQLKDQISDGTLQPLAGCKRIERLTLTDCTKLTDLSVSAVIEGNRNLLAIDVSGVDAITDKTLWTIANNCLKLQGLNATKCGRITDDSLAAIARNCRRVKRLKLNECAQVTDHSILAFADNCHDMLEIDLHGCVNLTDISVTSLIREGRQLRELRLAQCFRLTDESFLALPGDHVYENLRVLDLTDCHQLTDSGVTKIVNAAPRLRNLVLAKCRNVTDRGVISITRLGKNLHYIHLGHCSRITDHGVSHLVKFCSRIRYIDLACCTNLTDDSVSLLATLPKLKRIGLVKCSAITDRSLRALARPKSPAGNGGPWPNMLERLHLSYCVQLTIAGVRVMLINCPKLTHLSLTGIQDFMRDDLLSFCRPPPSEFNPHQRDAFCVFSGHGVAQLRNHLREHYGRVAPQDADSDDEDMRDFDSTTAQLFNHNTQPHQFFSALQAQGFPIPTPQHAQALVQQFQATWQQGLQQQNHTHIPGVQQYQQHLHQLQLLQQLQQAHQQAAQPIPPVDNAMNPAQHDDQQQDPQTPTPGQASFMPPNQVLTPFMTPGDFATAHLHAHPFTPRPLTANPISNPLGTPLPGTPLPGMASIIPPPPPITGLGIMGQVMPPSHIPTDMPNMPPSSIVGGPMMMPIANDEDDDVDDEDLNDEQAAERGE